MSLVRFENVTKAFGDVQAVQDVNLVIQDGEFVSLLGPSGCGKTTTLRLLAGFIRPSQGEIYIGEQLVSSAKTGAFVPPNRRRIGMVFQDYAIWPHMTVLDNVAYPLKLKGLGAAEQNHRAEAMLELVDMGGFASRFPHELSGGQQQRVALARALINEPDVLLLDEPLSNLDAKLREAMRFEIIALQRKLRMTVVYVTHDQSEAIVMSDRIAVMAGGRVRQVGSPREIYQSPRDRFVAGFIGQASFLPGRLEMQAGGQVKLYIGPPGEEIACGWTPSVKMTGPVSLCLRPHDADIVPSAGDITGTVVQSIYMGDNTLSIVKVAKHELRLTAPGDVAQEPGQVVHLRVRQAVILPPEEA